MLSQRKHDGESTKWLTPELDITFITPHILQQVFLALHDKDEGVLDYVADGHSYDSLIELAKAVGQFVDASIDNRDFRACWKDSGLAEFPSNAAIDLVARRVFIGLLSAYHYGIAPSLIKPGEFPEHLKNTKEVFLTGFKQVTRRRVTLLKFLRAAVRTLVSPFVRSSTTDRRVKW